MSKEKNKNILRKKRHIRVRKKVHGTAERPRLSVYRSAKHMYVQLIDDEAGKTLSAVSTLSSKFKEGVGNKTLNVDIAKRLGSLIGEVAKEIKVTKVVFDRAGYKYHGKIQALADSAREAGLVF